MPTKIITLDERFYTGEPTVQLVATAGRNDRILRERTSLHGVKTAAESPALDFIRNIEPMPGKTVVLVIGLGDHETYGPNRNGDGFPSEPIPGKIEPHEVLTKHFQSYDNAHVFEHHVNKDPSKAIGKVIKSFWNPYMRRVEVLEYFDHDKAPHLLERITNGEFPSKSMGCRIPYDTCSICANKAATRKDYCDHLKFQMNKVFEDGKQACALNPSVDLFDSSWVFRPADRTGFMLKKVARDGAYEIKHSSYELGELADALRHKSAEIGKAADMEKIITGQPEASVTGLDKGTVSLVKKYSDEIAPREAAKLPGADQTVRVTIEYTPGEVVGTSDAMGLPLGVKDLLRYFMERMGAGTPSEGEELEACKHAGVILDLFAAYPRFYEDVVKVAGLEDLRVNEKLANAMGTFTYKDRPVHETPLASREHSLVPPSFQQNVRPNTDTLTYTTPQGQVMRTNLGLARRATTALEDDASRNKYLRGAGYLGLGTVLGGAGTAAAMLSKSKPKQMLGRAAMLGGLALGGKGIHEGMRSTRLSDLRSPMVMTNEGEIIPAATEFKAASWRPEMLYPVLRAKDGACVALEPQRKLAFERAVRAAEVHDELSPVLGPTLDLEKVARIVEQSILSAL